MTWDAISAAVAGCARTLDYQNLKFEIDALAIGRLPDSEFVKNTMSP
jgi:hypothetical protein